jgi:hypothetical protein
LERGTPEERKEFAALSAKVSSKAATEEERTRWRVLRGKLAGPPPPPPAGRKPPAPQREHARQARKLRLQYTEVKTMLVGFSDELSAGGLRFRLHHFVDTGTMFIMRLELAGANDPNPLMVMARCIWCRHEGGHYLAGVELVNVRPDDKERIEAYLHSEQKG